MLTAIRHMVSGLERQLLLRGSGAPAPVAVESAPPPPAPPALEPTDVAPCESVELDPEAGDFAMRVNAPTDYELQEWLGRERANTGIRAQQFAKVTEELIERRQREDRDRAKARNRAEGRRGARREHEQS